MPHDFPIRSSPADAVMKTMLQHICLKVLQEGEGALRERAICLAGMAPLCTGKRLLPCDSTRFVV